MNDRLYRSTTDRVFSGLCGGMAEHFDLDPALVRLGWVVLDVLTGIFPLLVVYVIMVLVVPEEAPIGAPGQWPSWSGPQWGPAPAPGGAAPPGAAGLGGSTTAGPAGQAPGETGTPGQPDAGSAPGAADQGGGTWGPWGPPPPIGSDWRTIRAYSRAQRRAERAYWRSQRRGDGSTAGLVFGVILVVIGGLFLLRRAVPGLDTALFWPVVLIVLGALLLAGAFRR